MLHSRRQIGARARSACLAIIIIATAGAAMHAPDRSAAGEPADRDATITCIAADAGAEDERIAGINRLISERGYRWTAGRTSVSGLSDAEKRQLLGFVPPPDGWLDTAPPYAAPPRRTDFPVFDWREYGGVTPVKDQGTCGACWAFAATGQLEAHIMIYDGRIEDLSEQHAIDCNTMAFGCGGGWHWTALELLQYAGAVRELCYPYIADDEQPCKQSQCRIVAHVAGFAPVEGDHAGVEAIKLALLDGPVSSAIAMPCEAFYYRCGLFESDTAEDLNHVVVIAGWDDTRFDGEGAWICKNSWGTGWGEEGYFYVRYGACLIGTHCYQIEYEPPVRLISPNGGEVIAAGRDYLITWRTENEIPDSFTISLSLDGGRSFDHTVTRGLRGARSFPWKAPAVHNSTLRIRIESYFLGGLHGRDASDDDFTVRIVNFLDPIYPNPFNGTTTVPYAVERSGPVTVAIYDIAGRMITILERERRDPGIYEAVWDGRDTAGRTVAPGVYLCRVEAAGFSGTRKIIHLK